MSKYVMSFEASIFFKQNRTQVHSKFSAFLRVSFNVSKFHVFKPFGNGLLLHITILNRMGERVLFRGISVD